MPMTRNEYRMLNTRVMDDTYLRCKEPGKLNDSVNESIAKEYVVYQTDDLAVTPEKNDDMKVFVSSRRTFEAAQAYKDSGKKICCLNFANNHSVGGAPWTAGAQEEGLCRTSTLYPCMKAQQVQFYDRHVQDFIKGDLDDMGNDDLMYVPGVTVFKSDVSEPEMLDEDQWFNTDVIVSAAPVLGWNFDHDRYINLMERRIKRILDVAEKEKVQVLILGAFGCGAFHNPPEIVARLFKQMIRNYSFETVEFAVYCRSENTNYTVFKSVIEG